MAATVATRSLAAKANERLRGGGVMMLIADISSNDSLDGWLDAMTSSTVWRAMTGVTGGEWWDNNRTRRDRRGLCFYQGAAPHGTVFWIPDGIEKIETCSSSVTSSKLLIAGLRRHYGLLNGNSFVNPVER